MGRANSISRRAFGLGIGAVLIGAQPAFAGNTRYLYDALGRVVGVLYSNGGSVFYSYDAAGNRTQKRSGSGVTADGFDPDFYRIIYPDIYNAGVDPYTHYNNTGWHEGRNPSAYFSTTWYLNTYADIRNAGINPLQHYHSYGWQERRNPSTLFNTSLYLQNYSDIAAANIDPLAHFVSNGIYEGRSPFGTDTFN